MKKTAALLICAALFAGLASCKKQDKKTDDSSDTASGVTDSAFTGDDTSGANGIDNIAAPENLSLNEFDDELIGYICLNGYESADLVISPAAFRASLCLAAAGAQGTTQTELLNAAGFSRLDELDEWYKGLNDCAAASAWSNKDFVGEFTDVYSSNVSEKYGANAYSYSSAELTQGAANWISRKSDGIIKNAADDLSGASALLISTLKMDSAWTNAFSDVTDREYVFVGKNGKEQHLEFMEQTGEYLYAEENGVQVVVIPMENDISFVCFLGNRTDRFDKLSSLKREEVHVVLPMFGLESALDSRDLFGFLLQRGTDKALDSQAADFANMCSGNWFMQEAIQKVSISAGKKGIATASVSGGTAASPDTTPSDGAKEFIADAPFSFAVFSDLGGEDQHMLLYGQMINGE